MPIYSSLGRDSEKMKSMKGRLLKKLKFIPSLHHHKRNNLSEAIAETNGLSKPELSVCCNDKNVKPFIENSTIMENSEASDTPEIINENYPSLLEFEEECPPGGSESVILYTTSLRSIRKTFEDCQAIKFLLESFKVMYYERDVSLHLEFREELWELLGGRVIPPRLFIKGRYIGGADEVVGLHEQGKLKKMFEGVSIKASSCPCKGCGNMRFVVCSNCNGSCKVFVDGENDTEMFIRCNVCNENGLVKCPICS